VEQGQKGKSMSEVSTQSSSNGGIEPHFDPQRRHDVVLLFDVTDGNPNGDPDSGNMPRQDPETMHGLVTDGAIKRKIRDWVDASRGNESRFKIYVQSHDALNTLHQRAYDALDIKARGSKQPREDVEKTQKWMCENFFDVRTFGAVMSTGVNAGQVRGPVQLTFARSIDPIVPMDVSITRIAITKPEEMAVVLTEEGTEGKGKRTEMGRKALVPYGLYRTSIFVNPHFGERTGFDGTDLAELWNALQLMWDLDRSAARGQMACRGLYIFSHENKLGNAPAHQLLERISINRKSDVTIPRQFDHYTVSIDESDLPAGVTLKKLVGK
jgi:CRISPR-associated protein Csd2